MYLLRAGNGYYAESGEEEPCVKEFNRENIFALHTDRQSLSDPVAQNKRALTERSVPVYERLSTVPALARCFRSLHGG